MPRTGRRPGPGRTEEKILAAARTQFGTLGFDRTTIRGIARKAGVDPKLVLHYFESKAGLFRAAVQFPFDPASMIPKLLGPGMEGVGLRVARFFVELMESPDGQPALAMLRTAVATEEAAALLREFAGREILGRIAEALELDRPRVRASLAASQLVGLGILRYVVRVEPLASARPEQVVRWIGPTLQRYFAEPGALAAPSRSAIH